MLKKGALLRCRSGLPSGAGRAGRWRHPSAVGTPLKLTAQRGAIAAYRNAEGLLPYGRAAAELSALGVVGQKAMASPEEAIEAHIRDGDRLRDVGDHARAAAAYRDAISLAPMRTATC